MASSHSKDSAGADQEHKAAEGIESFDQGATQADTPSARRRREDPAHSGASPGTAQPVGALAPGKTTPESSLDESSGKSLGKSEGKSLDKSGGKPAGKSLGKPEGKSPATPASRAPEEVAREREVKSARRFLIGLAGFFVSACAALFLTSGDVLAKQIAVAGFISGLAGSLWFLWLIRDPSQYSSGRLAGIFSFLIAASYPGIYFCGVFSPAPAIAILGLSLLGLGSSPRLGLMTYLGCAAVQGALAALILTEILPDRGLIDAQSLGLGDAIALQILIQLLLAGGFAVARVTRVAALASAVDRDKIGRKLAQREALLLEARYELDRALQMGAPGRHSDRVIGGFCLGNVIGRGAMGEIYEATHTDTRKHAAVKLLHPHALEKPNQVKRFMREAEAAMQLSSDHVVEVYEVGETDGVPYMVMERLRGRDLAYYLRNSRRLSMPRVIDLLRQIGTGLEVARQAGIVHRDIKPQNVFYAEQSDKTHVWKILDFGISKLADSSGTLTNGKVVGTPGYMAPEQARGKEVDYRCDLFALGVIAYRALTGSPPFSGKDMAGVLYQVVYRMPRRPSSLVEMPRDVDRVLAIAMAKARVNRFDSGIELADALTQAASSNLDPALRDRADAIIEAHPWGTKLTRDGKVWQANEAPSTRS